MMHLFNRLPGSLIFRLLAGFVLLAVLPGLVLLVLSFLWFSRDTMQNYEALLLETAQRREAVITQEFDAAFNTLNGFVSQPVTYQLLYNALVFRSTTSATGANNRLSTLVNTPGQDRFDSVWLLNRAGTAVASAVQTGKILPFTNTDRSTSVSFAEAERIAEAGDQYKIVVENTDGEKNVTVQMITIIRDTGRRPIGYVVALMNLDTLFYDHFAGTINDVEAHGYVVPPSASTSLTTPDEADHADNIPKSPAVLRALAGEPPRFDRYIVEEDEGEVLAYAQRFTVTDTPFVLVTEIHMDDVLQKTVGYLQVAAFPLILGSLVLSGVMFWVFRSLIADPLNEMTVALQAMSRGIMDVNLSLNDRQDEFGTMARLFTDVRQQTAQTSLSLTQRLRDRERDVRVTQSIIQALAGERDLQSLMNRVVQLIVENFPMIYHAQIFLTDTENYAVLRASTGEVGQQLMSRGHRLAVGSVSVIGQAAQQRHFIIARDTSSSELHRRNEFLPDTRAELAIPLIINQDVIGALDVQSKERDAFNEDMIGVMQSLAAQISIALENVRLFEDAQRRLSQTSVEQQVDVRREWGAYLQSHRRRRLSDHAGNVTGYDFKDLRAAALQKGGSVVGAVTSRGTIPFVVLITLRHHTLGVLEFELPQMDFNYDKVLLAEELSTRLAISLDNARLFQESRRAAERERTVNTISANLTSKTDVNEILQMAIQEVSLALRSSQVSIQLHRPNASDDPAAPVLPSPPANGTNGSSHSHDD